MRATIQQLPVQTPPHQPAKQPWWHVTISANDYKSRAIYDAAKFTLYILITAFGGRKLFQTSHAKVPYVALTALGVFLMFRILWPRRRKGEPSKTLIFAVLQQDCETLLSRYKALMFDH